jgi:rubrerythrin
MSELPLVTNAATHYDQRPVERLDAVADTAAPWSEAASLSSRRKLVGIAALGVFAAVPGVERLLRVGDAFAASPSKAQDVRILQLVLQLEYTQVAFYEQAVQKASLQGELLEFARAALVHERAHLAAIKQALGAKAGPRPRFAFGAKVRSPQQFTRTAIKLEDIAVAGYNGQATNLTPATLAAAATIVSVEARHASWVRTLAGEVAAPEAVDKPMTAAQVASGLHEIGLRA